MPKISAILPIYGEKYIEQSLRSLLEQTLDGIEFILVDGRSPDSAYDLAMKIIGEEQYAHLRDSIKIIRHDANKGAHIVRRTGWEASTGDYIYQFDSDDCMDRDILQDAWTLPWREFLKVLPEERARILACKGVPFKTRLGHLTKLLGIHGISKLFCIIAFFV